ncbi:WxL domain-containing protein [Lactiplantibacillus paraplantarum]|uniref:WxL domain-containing protein n=1 Tax=Lactiplantibacillus paraplantarum TaxID=60520 RepID=UPI000FEE9867|nr:WxL domain-containing protein [Lactiplantibacillus paraplantarum]RKD28397.1 cell surface protein [Lactiplantibacillus paraplantarum]
MVLLQVMAADATVSLGTGMTAQADTLPQLTFAKSTASDNILTNQHFDVELQVSNTASKTNTIDLPNDVNLDGPEEFKQIKKVFKDSHYTSGDNGAFTVTAKQLTVAYNPDKRRITVQWSDEYPQVKVPIRLTAVKAGQLALVAVADGQKGPALNVDIKAPKTQASQSSSRLEHSSTTASSSSTTTTTSSSQSQTSTTAQTSVGHSTASSVLNGQSADESLTGTSDSSSLSTSQSSSLAPAMGVSSASSATPSTSNEKNRQALSSSNGKQASASSWSNPLIPVTRLTQLSTNVANVSTWDQLVGAWKNASVDEINITTDISNASAPSGALDSRLSGNIIVNGNGHSVNLGRAGFHTRYNSATRDTLYTATFMNFAPLTGSFGNDAGLIGSTTGGDGGNAALNWTFNVSNITVPSGTRNSDTSRRFVSAEGNQVNVTGNCQVVTYRENILCGGLNVAAGQTFTGSKLATGDNNSFIWFVYDQQGTGDRKVNVEEDATLNCIRRPVDPNSTAYTTYPVVFDAYESINIGKNATFNASIPGNAYSNLYFSGSQYHRDLYADTGSTVNLTSLARSQSPISFSNNATSTIQSSSGANVYVIAATGAPLISGNYARLATVRFIKPNNLDLRNSSTGAAAATSSINQDNVGTFEIQDSNISLWRLASSITGGADYSYNSVAQLQQQGTTVSATNSNLQSNYLSSKMRRISAINQKPQLSFNNPYDGTTRLTDADQKLRTRVIVAMVPDTNGVQDDGKVHYIPQYASAGQLTVSYQVNGKTVTAPTDSNGYATANLGAFLKAGTTVTASTDNASGTMVTATETVVDVTPPNPATKVVPDPIRVSSGTVSGQNGEPGAQVTLALNGQIQTNVKTVVNANGTWSLDLTGLSLKIGDKIIIYMADSLGNRNPDPNSYPNGQQYHDATFQPAPIFTVAKDLIVNPIDPDDPSKPGTGGTNNLGPLSLDAVPTHLNFGQHSIPTMDTAYPLLAPSAAEDQLATATDGQKYATVGGQKNGQDSVYTQVTDTRDTPSGWQLTAQLSALTANDGTTMTGSYVTLTSGIAQYLNASTNKWVTSADQNQATLPAMIKLTPGATQQTLIAGTTGQQGVGTNQQIWNVNNVALHVQGGRVMAKNYSGTITWQLNSLPSQ